MGASLKVAARRGVFKSWLPTSHKLALGLIVASCAVFVVVGAAGPSAVALNLGPRYSFLPPWYLPFKDANWNEWAVTAIMWGALVLGAVGLWIGWRALKAGWRPRPWRLFGLGAGLSTVVGLVLPLTSADVMMYAAYGRLQVIGQNPYTVPPAQIFRQEFDAVLVWTERPWQDTPSVYGPLASAVQWLSATLGGANMHDIVFWLQMFTLVPFLAIGIMVMVMMRGDEAAQARAALLTVCNPIMICAVVAGAHNEALAMVFAVAGLYFMRKNPWLAGLGIGLAGTVKVSLIFVGVAMLWGYRHDRRKLVRLVVGAVVPLAVAYAWLAPQSILAAQRNTDYVSAGSWAEPIYTWLEYSVGVDVGHWVTFAGGWIGMAIVGWMLSRVLPRDGVPGVGSVADSAGSTGVDPATDPLTQAARAAVVLVGAWLVASPYTWVWYDYLVWVPLALLAVSRIHGILLWRGLWLSVAYVTGRIYNYGADLAATSAVLRDEVCTVAQYITLALIVGWWWRRGHELPPPVVRAWRRLRGPVLDESAGSGTAKPLTIQ